MYMCLHIQQGPAPRTDRKAKRKRCAEGSAESGDEGTGYEAPMETDPEQAAGALKWKWVCLYHCVYVCVCIFVCVCAWEE
jgi:hypothetical protein